MHCCSSVWIVQAQQYKFELIVNKGPGVLESLLARLPLSLVKCMREVARKGPYIILQPLYRLRNTTHTLIPRGDMMQILYCIIRSGLQMRSHRPRPQKNVAGELWFMCPTLPRDTGYYNPPWATNLVISRRYKADYLYSFDLTNFWWFGDTCVTTDCCCVRYKQALYIRVLDGQAEGLQNSLCDPKSFWEKDKLLRCRLAKLLASGLILKLDNVIRSYFDFRPSFNQL